MWVNSFRPFRRVIKHVTGLNQANHSKFFYFFVLWLDVKHLNTCIYFIINSFLMSIITSLKVNFNDCHGIISRLEIKFDRLRNEITKPQNSKFPTKKQKILSKSRFRKRRGTLFISLLSWLAVEVCWLTAEVLSPYRK